MQEMKISSCYVLWCVETNVFGCLDARDSRFSVAGRKTPNSFEVKTFGGYRGVTQHYSYDKHWKFAESNCEVKLVAFNEGVGGSGGCHPTDGGDETSSTNSSSSGTQEEYTAVSVEDELSGETGAR